MTIDISIALVIIAGLIFILTVVFVLTKNNKSLADRQANIEQRQNDVDKQLINQEHARLNLEIDMLRRQEKLREELLGHATNRNRLEGSRSDNE